jgi:small subunit ribosomal protein S16
MLAIKLQRVGKKHQPSYRMVVAEKRSKLIGPPIEDLGAYSTLTKQSSLNAERISYWIGVGAQPTMTVHNLLVKQGVLKAPKKAVKMSAKGGSASGGNEPEPKVAVEEKPKTEEVVAEAKKEEPAAETVVDALPESLAKEEEKAE